ncbi:hypothetical protein [Salmonirosea aquatica]|uniref:DUF4595 domain-containing protein n=1 Tax=Salmonirosea aquatica TaxID=2654236 RepID=A0A7C9BG39_9BACT|nr:hypothetical protein [Cytophagaceae bacterium SJW1-29]
MKSRLLVGLGTLALLAGCSSHSSKDYSLDPGIPRVETPDSQIAYIRTKWMNEKHVETAFFDNQDRPLEVFRFGRTSVKTLNRYEGEKNTRTIRYYHSDSSPFGWIDVDTLRRTYDSKDRVIVESHTYSSSYSDKNPKENYYKRYLDYTTEGDTMITKQERGFEYIDSSTVADVDRWEKNSTRRLGRHYRLYITKVPSYPPDTVYHFSQRFAYDSTGKLALTWFDYKRPGGFVPGGAETIWYRYDVLNRLTEERHYTGDVIKFFEKSGLDVSVSAMQQDSWYSKNTFAIDSALRKNKDYFSVKYRYETFDHEKHLPLKIPTN